MPEWLQVLLVVLVVGAMLGVMFWACDLWEKKEQARVNVCLEAGYAERVQLMGKWFCIGYDREGQPVIAEWAPLWEARVR